MFDVLVGVLPRYVPLILVIAVIINMIASMLAPRFEPKSSSYRIIMPVVASAMIVLSTIGLWVPAAIILAHGGLVLMRIGGIYLTADLQHAVKDNVRATVGSLGEFFAYFIAIAAALLVAALSYFLSGLLPFRYSAGIILLLTTLAWWLTRAPAEKTS